MRRKKRQYILTVEMTDRKGNTVIKKFKARGIDSIHASANIYRIFGRNRIKIVSAVLVKEDKDD